MIKIGLVNLDTTHPLAFSEYMQKGNRARYSAIYNDSFRDDEEIEAFMRKYTLEKRCRSIEELADSVDIGFARAAIGITISSKLCLLSNATSLFLSTSRLSAL